MMKAESKQEIQATPFQNTTIRDLLRRRAKRSGKALRWNRNSFLLSYAVLAATLIVALRVRSELVMAPVAVLGLAIIWVFSNLQEKRLEADSFEEEVQAYQELLVHQPQERGESEPVVSAVTPLQSPLSTRELEVLSHIANGKSNKQAAMDLYISEQTVKNHIKHIFSKLEVSDRTSAILLAMRNGWIETDGLDFHEPGVR